jgi:hypothetical protein
MRGQVCYASGSQVLISQGVIKKSACLDNYLDKNCFGACICKLPWGLLEKIHHCCSWVNGDICRYTIINFKVLCKKGVAPRANLLMVSCYLLNLEVIPNILSKRMIEPIIFSIFELILLHRVLEKPGVRQLIGKHLNKHKHKLVTSKWSYTFLYEIVHLFIYVAVFQCL